MTTTASNGSADQASAIQPPSRPRLRDRRRPGEAAGPRDRQRPRGDAHRQQRPAATIYLLHFDRPTSTPGTTPGTPRVRDFWRL